MAVEISDLSELRAMSEDVTEDYTLVANIDASGTSAEDEHFVCIGTSGSLYSGTFEGGGYKISDITYGENVSGVGLFGFIHADGIVQNVFVDVAGLVGAFHYVGGIVGYNYGTIKNCVVSGSISDSSEVYYGYGGIAGRTESGSSIDNCYNFAAVSISSSSNRIGGIVGRGNAGASITDCYNYGPLSSGAATVGGCVGDGAGTITDCFWDSETTPTAGTSISGGGTGKTTAQMQDIDTYTTGGVDWDITTEALHDGDIATAVWFIDDGNDYPKLYFEYVSGGGGSTIDITKGSLSFSGKSLFIDKTVYPTCGSMNFTGKDVGTYLSTNIGIGSGTISLTGKNLNFQLNRTQEVGSTSLTITGKEIQINKNHIPGAGGLTLTGQDFNAQLLQGSLIGIGSLSATGKTMNHYLNKTITLNDANLVLTGTDVSTSIDATRSIPKAALSFIGEAVRINKLIKIGNAALRFSGKGFGTLASLVSGLVKIIGSSFKKLIG